MHDSVCTDPNQMYYLPLADRVRYFKVHKEGVKAKNYSLEEIAENLDMEIKQVGTLKKDNE